MAKNAVVLFLALTALALATAASSEEADDTCNALFVHNAESVSIQGDTLTMKGISPTVIYFCDRPQRFAGHLTVENFLSSVSKGKDSFAEDPPNAVVSIANGDEFVDVVVTLNCKPVLNGDQLVYSGIQVIEGDLPNSAGPGSIFIDVIGRPMSPGSVAGVHRRHRRRAMRRCAAGVTCY
jgi:hypothetical protein